MNMKLVKSIRAVSPLIATILLIAITVAGGLVTYALFTSTAGVSSAKGQVSFESVDLVRTGGQLAFAATLKNAGNKPVENITVSLHQNQALSFDGIDDYLQTVKNVGITGSSARTLVFWCKVKTLVDQKSLIGWGDPNTQYKNFAVAHLDAGAGVKWFFWGSSYDWDTGVTPQTGVWQHHVLTFDGTKVRWYINDVELGVGADMPLLNTSDSPVSMGHETDGWMGYANIDIDEVRIYNRTLTAEEIRESYQGYSIDEGLILYLPFDGDTKDYSGMGNDGTNYGAVSIDAPDVYVVGGLEPGRTVAISEAVRVSGPHGKYVVGNRYSITVSAVYVDGSESAATTTVICR